MHCSPFNSLLSLVVIIVIILIVSSFMIIARLYFTNIVKLKRFVFFIREDTKNLMLVDVCVLLQGSICHRVYVSRGLFLVRRDR